MARSTGTALYVLRLVLQRETLPATRYFSTAVIDRERDRSKEREASSSSSWTGHSLFPGLKALASRSVSEDEGHLVDFLEDEGTEYTAVNGVLPTRSSQAKPIPWPTIFAHPERERDQSAAEAGPSRPMSRLCDPIVRLVEEGDLVGARKVYDELKSHGLFVQPRFVYLEAAKQRLEANDTEGFLFWLRLYPNRPATSNHPGLRAVWEPITNLIINQYTFDMDFLGRYGMECARMGVLPAVVHVLIRHFTFITTPDKSRQVVADVLSTYKQHTTSATSTSERARRQHQIVQSQVDAWTEAYKQAVASHGYFTDQVMRQADLVTPYVPITIPPEIKRLRDRIEFAIETPPVAADLVRLIIYIRANETPEDETDFRERFIRPPHIRARELDVPSEIRAYEWWRAIMMVESRRGSSQGVIDTFQRHFHWFGLPDHPCRRSSLASDDTESRSLLYPRRSIMTTLLPALRATLPSFQGDTPSETHDDIIAFHKSYLEQCRHAPPILQPDGHIHNIFIRAIAHYCSTDAAITAIRTIASYGYDCGVQSMTTLLIAFGRSSQYDEMFTLLEAMERGDSIQRDTVPLDPALESSTIPRTEIESGMLLPAPTANTYDWLASVITRKRQDPEIAQKVLRMKEAFFQSQGKESTVELEESTKTVTI